ncbi:MAG TPA: DUF4920 domain-containing protein [Acidobacteriota bacterium]|nr:DUF4920 domain-containing protein [Acidobacteriota bacterium]
MTFKRIFGLLFVLGFLSCGQVLLGQEYGSGVQMEESVSIAQILENPEQLEGKRVRIDGQVVEVCAMAGCWIEVSDQQGDRIRVKVDDGVIVFPQSLKGQTVKAEGTVEVLPMSRQQYVDWLKHLAEETGNEFDPETVGEPPYQIVRLHGLGAEVTQPG